MTRQGDPSGYRLFFLKKGTDMASIHIEGGRDGKIQGLKRRATLRGATVLNHFDARNPPYPTHIVVSNFPLPAKSVAEALGFDCAESLSAFLAVNSIFLVRRKWADKGHAYSYPPFEPPSQSELYHVFLRSAAEPLSASRVRSHETPQGRSVRFRLESPGPVNDAPTPRRLAVQGSLNVASASAPKQILVSPFSKNQELSDLFREIAKLYQSAPLEHGDEFKALSFSTTSSRLKRLNFEVTDSDLVKNISGFGPSTLQIIQEYLDTHRSGRLIELQTDPKRVRIRKFMNVWGVGIVRARELARVASNVDELRRALDEGRIKLDRNQLIGLECYEDIQEEMSREEVEAIFAIVKDCVELRFPSAELSLMGSYRRGVKATCGDADILITHPDHVPTVPPMWLGRIVDDLCAKDHVAYHLTFISGMRPERFETLPVDAERHMADPSHYGRAAEKSAKHASSSYTYMGVFHSPVVPGRRRRVDIKFYPYQERAFASLYFTGNGHFNRSIRLWSDRKRHATLNDHGLFERGTSMRVRDRCGKDFLPREEREIFDWLGLAWREPHERDGFDAVEDVDGSVLDATRLSQKEKEHWLTGEAEHPWIN